MFIQDNIFVTLQVLSLSVHTSSSIPSPATDQCKAFSHALFSFFPILKGRKPDYNVVYMWYIEHMPRAYAKVRCDSGTVPPQCLRPTVNPRTERRRLARIRSQRSRQAERMRGWPPRRSRPVATSSEMVRLIDGGARSSAREIFL